MMKKYETMKKMAMLAALSAILAGCATGPTGPAGLRESDLRDPKFFRAERVLPLSFPKIQMALFKHQAACGSAPVFSMDARQTNYATIVQKPAGAVNFEHAVLADLEQLQDTMMAPSRAKATVYTYYADAATIKQIDQVFNAIAHPEVCPGAN